MAAPQQAEAIADYAVIGDTRSIALISRRGSIDWLCWPRFDAPSIFARLLDADKGGHFAIAPAVPCTATRRYVGETNVLETTFACDDGEATLVDLMPVQTEEEKRHRLTPFRQILRRIECVRGEVPIAVDFAPRPDYARIVPRLELRGFQLLSMLGRVFKQKHLRSGLAWCDGVLLRQLPGWQRYCRYVVVRVEK